MSGDTQQKSGFRLWMLIPPVAALAVLALFYTQLGNEQSRNLPSTLIGKQVPQFDLPPLHEKGLATADLKGGGVKLLNIWASWCGPCRVEHPQLMDLAARGITVHGLNYKDQPGNAKQFLAELGDPYDRIGADQAGKVGFELGVYGVPETFVINDAGEIVYKHVGPIVRRDIEEKLLPAIERAAGN